MGLFQWPLKKMDMTSNLSKFVLATFILIIEQTYLSGNERIKFSSSINIYKDLSDTYGSGSLFSGGFDISKSWYGASLNFGYYHAQSTFIYNIIFEEQEKVIEIKFDEVSYMYSSSISLIIIPIQNNHFRLDINIGPALNKATSSQFNSVDYSYNLEQDKFNYLYKDYKLIDKIHFGYQIGFNLSYYFSQHIGLQMSSRIQDLSNGGTFFFVGGGLCFKF